MYSCDQWRNDWIKGMINLNGLLQSVVMILCAVAFFKSGKKEDNEHVD